MPIDCMLVLIVEKMLALRAQTISCPPLISLCLDLVDRFSLVDSQDYNFKKEKISLLCGGRAQAFQTIFNNIAANSTAKSNILFLWHGYIPNFDTLRFDETGVLLEGEKLYKDDMIATHAVNEVLVNNQIYTVDATLMTVYKGRVKELRQKTGGKDNLVDVLNCSWSDIYKGLDSKVSYRMFYGLYEFYNTVKSQKYLNVLDIRVDEQINKMLWDF